MLKTKIPVRHQYVRQFIMARYGCNTPVISLSKKSLLGILAEMASEKIGFRHVLPKSEVEENRCIVLEYPESLKSHFIHPTKALVLAKTFEYLFNQSFLESVESCVRLGLSDYYAVDFFMEKYGLTEDMIAADTLRKKWRNHQYYMSKKLTLLAT